MVGPPRRSQRFLRTACAIPLLTVMALGCALAARAGAALFNSLEALASNGRSGVVVWATAVLGRSSGCVATLVPEDTP